VVEDENNGRGTVAHCCRHALLLAACTCRAYVAALHCAATAASAAGRSRRAAARTLRRLESRLEPLRMPEPSPLVTIGDGDS